MTKERNGKLSVDGVLALVLFGVFSVCVLLVLLQGARSYERLTTRGQESYDERTAAQYIVTRIRQADACGCVSLGTIDGIQTLELAEVIDGENYTTRVYCYDGYIRELFCADRLSFSAQDGQSILPAKSLAFSIDGDLIAVNIVLENGEEVSFCAAIRSGGGVSDEK